MDRNRETRPAAWQLNLGLIIGLLAVSTAAILVRLTLATVDAPGLGFSLVMAATRLSLAALLLLPTWWSRPQGVLKPGAIGFAIAAGGALAIHFATWISSLLFTSIAASTTLVTTNPIWVVLLSWVWFRERPNRPTLMGIGLALSGGLLIGVGDLSDPTGSDLTWLGNGLALLGAVAVSLYILLGREAQRRGLGVGRYVAIAYSVAALMLLPLPLVFGTSYLGYPVLTYGYLLLMALVPQLLGHTSFNWAVRWISPTLLTLVILVEPVIASGLGYFIFGEVPGTSVWLGAVLLLTGVACAAVAHAPPGNADRQR